MTELVYDKTGPAKDGIWRGYRSLKYPTDLFLYADIIHNQKPDFIIETGTRFGGSALFLADVCRLENKGKVISVEIEETYDHPTHTRLTIIKGDSAGEEVLDQIKEIVGNGSVLVILDSDHSPKHVMKELQAYSEFCTVGDYMVAEDIMKAEAYKSVSIFLKSCKGRFERDKSVEKYGILCGRDGFLKRVK